ncbi:MAG: PHP domain-containing protein [Acidimicrobiia bacterium]|nr:PHP domain-containing protein [Acidimicrobiia bacterium]
MHPVEALERIGHVLERAREPTYRVRAFRGAAAALEGMSVAQIQRLADDNRLRDLAGVGPKTERVIRQALAGEEPAYLTELLEHAPAPGEGLEKGDPVRAALKGDCHTHSDWSDGGSPIDVMAHTARDLGHEYIVLTDHSPRLTVAKGLSPERLRRQLEVVDQLNEELGPFRILKGIEVDINEDGTLDQEPALLERLDVVVASVHSKLRMDEREMTPRMVAAVSNPRVNILGHCTGRLVVGRGRPESAFDADAVFSACAEHDTAVEINSRPERLDPPRRLLRQAVGAGCKVSIDTDAHAPGQLEWQVYGCARAADCEVPLETIVNTWPADELVAWARS